MANLRNWEVEFGAVPLVRGSMQKKSHLGLGLDARIVAATGQPSFDPPLPQSKIMASCQSPTPKSGTQVGGKVGVPEMKYSQK